MAGTLVDQQTYRDAMARFGAAVSVITTAPPAAQASSGPDHWAGFTASAVCSVTDEPPTLLVCMNRGSSLNEVFKRNGILCVNTLHGAQQALSPLFAGLTPASMAERFAAARWQVLHTGAPALDDAVVCFDCRIVQTTEMGTHSVFFCEVAAIHMGQSPEGLIYFGRSYHRIVHGG